MRPIDPELNKLGDRCCLMKQESKSLQFAH